MSLETAIIGFFNGLILFFFIWLISFLYKKFTSSGDSKPKASTTNMDKVRFNPPSADDNKKWETAHNEYVNNRDIGLYAKLFALYEGDENKIKAHYLKERVAALNSLANTIAVQAPGNMENTSRTQHDVYGPITEPNQVNHNSKSEFFYSILFIAGLIGFFVIIMTIYSETENKKQVISNNNATISAVSTSTERLAIVGLKAVDNLEFIALLPFKSASCSEVISSFESRFLKNCAGCTILTRTCTTASGFENYLNNQRATHDYISDGSSRFIIIGDNNPTKARAACYRFVEMNKRGQCIEKL